MVKDWKLPSGTRNKNRMSHWPLLFDTVLEVPTGAIRQEKELQSVWIGKKEVNYLTEDVVTITEKPQEPF